MDDIAGSRIGPSHPAVLASWMKDARAPPTSVFIACEMSRGERPRYVGPHLCDLTSSASLILYLRQNISTWMNNDLLDGFPKRRLRVKRNKICTSNETIFMIIEGGGFHMMKFLGKFVTILILFPIMFPFIRRWKKYNNEKWCHRSVPMQISWKVVSRRDTWRHVHLSGVWRGFFNFSTKCIK